MAHINPGTDTTINPIIIDDSFRSKPTTPTITAWAIKAPDGCYTIGCFVIGCVVFLFNLFGEGIPFAARIMGMTLALGIWLFSITVVAFWESEVRVRVEEIKP